MEAVLAVKVRRYQLHAQSSVSSEGREEMMVCETFVVYQDVLAPT